MQSSEVYHMLGRRPRRGRIVFGNLFLVSLICCGVSSTRGLSAWVIVALLMGFLFCLGYQHVTERDFIARSVAENPGLVYWAHPAAIPTHNHWRFVFNRLRFLTLHLRDGRQFEAGLPPDEMNIFISWLVQQNPTIRMGSYDNTTMLETQASPLPGE